MTIRPDIPSPSAFFSTLNWIDGRDLADTIEPYRRRTHEKLLYTFRDDGEPQYNLAVIGRGKKNNSPQTSSLRLSIALCVGAVASVRTRS